MDRLQYGGADFEAVAGLLGRVVGKGRVRGAATVVRRPGALRGLARMARALPVIEVVPSGSPAGHELRAYLAERRTVALARFGEAVLDVPQDGSYLRGRSRQALRTNANRAKRAGVTWREVERACERVEVEAALSPRINDRGDWHVAPSSRREERWFVAEDEEGSVVVLATLLVDRDNALLTTFVADRTHPLRFDSRYLLKAALIELLGREGVRRLLVTGPVPLRTDAGTRHFQRILGFRIARVRLNEDVTQVHEPGIAA